MYRCLAPVVLLLVAVLGGCATPPSPAPQVLLIPTGQYATAFDAAVEAARARGLATGFQDRRAGWIETETAVAPSLLEPWGSGPSDFGTRANQTVALERRRVRFEFVPRGVDPSEPELDRLPGADVLGLETPRDLTEIPGPLELRVWAFTEQAFFPGLQVGTWTRRQTNFAEVVDPNTGETLPRTLWTPTSRDQGFELELLGAVDAAVGG